MKSQNGFITTIKIPHSACLMLVVQKSRFLFSRSQQGNMTCIWSNRIKSKKVSQNSQIKLKAAFFCFCQIYYTILAFEAFIIFELKTVPPKVQIFFATIDPLCSTDKVWHCSTNLSCGFHLHVTEMIRSECHSVAVREVKKWRTAHSVI